MKDDRNGNSGLGLASILTIIFVIAKITGYINWSWWLVFSPTIALFSFAILILIIALIITAISK
ncbi:hypothetical protein IGI37_002267 [Enterococcus sp. AZ194]|uniref:hypothetical protein n=1 Tax=Enterococcus sp. AZ194 TaxID=2774629 RepID=UPI003F217903